MSLPHRILRSCHLGSFAAVFITGQCGVDIKTNIATRFLY